MADNEKWVIKAKDGRIRGPYTTEQLLDMVRSQELDGNEWISTYPDIEWVRLSSKENFYDEILKVLNGQEERASVSEKTIPPAATRIVRIPAAAQQPEPTKAQTSVSQTIDLENIQKKHKKTYFIKLSMPIIFAVAVLATAAVFFSMGPQDTGDERIRLLSPRKGQSPMSEDQVKSKIQKALGEFSLDQSSNYLSAQSELVSVIEGNNKKIDVYPFLCLTYLELWPFAYQDSQDLKAMSTVMQMSAQVDPGGPYSGVCRVVDLYIRGRYQEAQNLTETLLQEGSDQPTVLMPFYYLKALVLDHEKDYISAASYLKSVQQLWPKWVKAHSLEGEIQLKSDKNNEAASLFRTALKINPEHKVSILQLGLLEIRFFLHPKQGEELLLKGVGIKQLISKSLLSKTYFTLAELKLKEGSTSKAMDYAKLAYQLNPSNAAAKNLLVQLGGVGRLKETKIKVQQLIFEGDQLAREGDCQSAQALYKTAFETDPKQATSALKAAECLWKLSFGTEAIDWLNKAIRGDPQLIAAYITLADYYSQRFDFVAASRTLTAAQRINPKSAEVYRGFALLELRRGNAKSAMGFVQKALSLYETDVESLLILAKAQLLLRDFRQAYGTAAKAVELDMNHREAQVVFSETLAGIQGRDAGIDYLTKLISSYPLVIEYRMALANLYLQDDKYAKSEEIVKQILRIDERPKAAYLLLAKIKQQQGQLESALEALTQASLLDPADPEPLFQAGALYLKVGKPAEASQQFSRILRINTLYPRVHYYLGMSAMQMNDAKEALNQAQLEKTANPNLADPYLLAAEAYAAQEQFSLCASEYQKAIRIRPQGVAVYVKLAQCYRKLGQFEVAITMLNQASTLESGYADIYKELGLVYEVKGDIRSAVESYNQYFALAPNAPDRAIIEGRISTLQQAPSR